MDNDHHSFYALLNVSRDASVEDVKKAYRALAQTFHPDKQPTAEARQLANDAFSKLQEAYEVLSDTSKRMIYDVYGKQGLNAGFEVGPHLDSVDQLKKQWEEFKAKQEQERQDAMTSHRGYYLCRLDVQDYVRPLCGYPHHPSHLPIVRGIIVSNQLDTPLSDKDFFHMQGQAALRGQLGSGNVIFGYKRIITDHDSVDVSAVVGLKNMFTLTSNRQLTQYSQASLSAVYNRDDGLGLQLSTTRQLFPTTSGSFLWVVGPTSTSGMSLSLTHRGKSYVLTGKLEVGISTALSARFSYLVTENASARVNLRLGLTGADVEVGGGYKWSPTNSGYLGASVGLPQGIMLKARYNRASQVFEFPILLSSDYTDWRVLVAAYTVPPLLSFVATRYLLRPLAAWQRRKREQAEQQQHAEAVRGKLAAALGELNLLSSVAKRKAQAEAERGGLVILQAIYGVIDSFQASHGSSTSEEVQEHMRAAAATAEDAGASGPSSSGGAEAGPRPLPPQWLDVTAAVQYLVVDGRLVLHGGTSKVGLMGFMDPAPSSDKQLRVAYAYRGLVYEAMAEDRESLELPASSAVVEDTARANTLLAKAAVWGSEVQQALTRRTQTGGASMSRQNSTARGSDIGAAG